MKTIFFVAYGLVSIIYAITCAFPLMILSALSCPLLTRNVILIENP